VVVGFLRPFFTRILLYSYYHDACTDLIFGCGFSVFKHVRKCLLVHCEYQTILILLLRRALHIITARVALSFDKLSLNICYVIPLYSRDEKSNINAFHCYRRTKTLKMYSGLYHDFYTIKLTRIVVWTKRNRNCTTRQTAVMTFDFVSVGRFNTFKLYNLLGTDNVVIKYHYGPQCQLIA